MSAALASRATALQLVGLVTGLLLAPAAQSYKTTLGNTEVAVTGYVKFDALISHFSDGAVAGNTPPRDFYFPGAIPVSGASEGRTYLDAHAKETRLLISTDTPVGSRRLGAHVEVDFLSNPGDGDERLANGYTLGVRRAFITYGAWTIGQDWSSFQNLVAVPESLNFVPWPSDGTVFSRQPLIRYTRGGFDVSVENPATTVTTATGARVLPDESVLPDVAARYRFSFGEGSYSLAGLVRQLRSDADDNIMASNLGVDDDVLGYGLSLAGAIPYRRGDVRFTLTAGEGLGRYVGLNAVNGAQIDGARLDAIPTVNGFIALRYEWTSQWRSTFTLSGFRAEHDQAFTGGSVTRRLQSTSVNLLYSPTPGLSFGGELRYAERETEDRREGSLTRLQLSAKYQFL